jgi:hypothetical protein
MGSGAVVVVAVIFNFPFKALLPCAASSEVPIFKEAKFLFSAKFLSGIEACFDAVLSGCTNFF